jgi:hypothetical protein
LEYIFSLVNCTVLRKIIFMWLKRQCHQIFEFRFFHDSVIPKPLSIRFRPFWIFLKNSMRYSQIKVLHWCLWHWWKMAKICNQKSFKYFFYTFG